MTVVLAQVVLPNISGLPIDNTVNDFVFTDATLSAAVADATSAVPDFYNGASGAGNHVREFISQTIDRGTNKCKVNIYDITSHLNGSPHGSPVSVVSFTLGAVRSAVDIPSECAVCFSYHSDQTGLAEVGGTDTAIPTEEEAIDAGAPATHTGKDRPKGRTRGRIYIGPLSFSAVKTSGGAQCTVADDLINALVGTGGAASRLLGLPGANWSQWSRRNAAATTVVQTFVDNEFDTQRRRRIKATARTVF